MKTLFSIFVVGFIYSVYYLSLGVYKISLGYRHYESLFISDKLQLLFTNDYKTLELFNFIYPSLTQLLAMPAALVDIIKAPLITSGISVAFFASYLVVKLFNLRLKFASVLVSIYFLCSPLMLFAAISGSSTYLFLILYFLFFHLIFRYMRTYTTYNFVLLSLCLTLFVFLDYTFLLISVFILPLLFLLSLFNSPAIDKSYLGIFSQVTQNFSTTKGFLKRFSSSFLVVFFTPFVSLLFYFIINYWFTNNYLYFNVAETSQWNQNNFFNSEFIDTSIGPLIESVLYLSPLLIANAILGRKRILFQVTLTLVTLWIIYSRNTSTGEQLFLPTLIMITASGMAAFIHLFQTSLLSRFQKSRILHLISFLVFSLTIVGEFYYFKNSQHNEEKKMFGFLTNREIGNYTPSEDMAMYINSNLSHEDIILTDNKIFYPTTALSRDNVIYLDQFREEYHQALQLPELYADYLLISDVNSNYYPKDQLKPVIENRKVEDFTIYSNSEFRLLKINK